MFDTDNKFDIWTKAFQKCLVILNEINNQNNLASQSNLEILLDTAKDWEILGVRDAIEYFDTCKGKREFLILAEQHWWLTEYFNKIYSPNPKFNPNNYPTVGIIDV
jgi:hypothetical protein